MRVLVDTSVWSLALRRKNDAESQAVKILTEYIESGEQVFVIGIIAQEILSGVTSIKLFNQLIEHLAAFPIIDLFEDDFIEAARLRNTCKKKGIQIGTIDALIAAVCIKHDLLLLSLDKDFQAMAGIMPLQLVSTDS
ncbi:MAG: PIN domain-containing protein [Actinomycetota bacterium]|nr:PIN domain-containing protein [Actinomycetota bacterium]